MGSQVINNFYLRATYKNPYYYINNVSTDYNYPITESPEAITTGGTIINYFLLTFGTPEATNLYITKNSILNYLSYADPVTAENQFSNASTLKTLLNSLGISAELVGTTLLISNAYAEQVTEITSDTSYITVSTGTTVDNTSLVQRVANNRYGNRSKVRMEIRYGKDNSIFRLSKVYIDYLKAPQFVRLTQDQIEEVSDNSQILEFPDYVSQEIVNELIRLLMENASDPRLQTHIPINQSIANPAQEPRK